jgi:hypothetical protein
MDLATKYREIWASNKQHVYFSDPWGRGRLVDPNLVKDVRLCDKGWPTLDFGGGDLFTVGYPVEVAKVTAMLTAARGGVSK